MFRHKGTYHTNEAKGAESAESADAAIMNNDPNFTETIDESKKEWLIWRVAIWLWDREGEIVRGRKGDKCTLLHILSTFLKSQHKLGEASNRKFLRLITTKNTF